ncbi:hypothetical protein BZA05DRAFT_458582, partial [Tricharina praecox]|uniref:uncharacterized protein n=1 Tax=Tricharina praecox TaxID=43433 RepID=UPI00221F5394
FDRSFPKPPTVFVGLSGFEVGNDRLIHLYTLEVGCDGFDIHIGSGIHNSGAQATWVAFPSDKAGVLVGDFSGDPNRGWSGTCTFPKPFDRVPNIFTAFTKIHTTRDYNLRARLDTRVFKDCMKWRIHTWGDTELFAVDASYFVVEE